MQVKKQQLEPDTEQLTGLKLGKVYEKAIPCLFNLYAEYIMQNDRLDESQPGIKLSTRNINNLRYADDTTLTGEIEEKLKRLLMRVKKESKKSGLKLSIKNLEIMSSSFITLWQIDREIMKTVRDFIF